MERRNMWGNIVLCVSVILLLSGCNFKSHSKESVMEDAQLAMQEVDNVEIKFKENLANNIVNGRYFIDVKAEETWIELADIQTNIYKEQDTFLIQAGGLEVEGLGDDKLAVEFTEMIEFLLDPYTIFSDFDKDYVEQFTLTEEKDALKLTSDSENSRDKKLAKEILFQYMLDAKYKADEAKYTHDIQVRDYVFELALDKETYTLKKMKMNITFEDRVDAPGEKFRVHNIYTYKGYDETDKIPTLEWNENDKEDKSATVDRLGNDSSAMSLEDVAAHVESIIEATIFQDVATYVAKDPSRLSDDEKEWNGKAHRDEFMNMYQDVISDYVQGIQMQEVDVDVWVDAALSALSKTNYQVVDVKPVADNQFTVTLSVEGIDESQVVQDAKEEMKEKGMDIVTKKGEELIDMGVLVKHFKQSELTDPEEVEFDVFLDGEGNFLTTSYSLPIFGSFVQ